MKIKAARPIATDRPSAEALTSQVHREGIT